MSIIIGADCVPTKKNIKYFEAADDDSLIGTELLNLLSKADYRIINLEVPLTDKSTPFAKSGPNLIAPTATVNGYMAFGIDLVTIANNHILDQGSNGLSSTITILDGAGIKHIGAGANLREAAVPHITSIGGKKVGVYACAEHEFSIATEKSAGANPFDPLESYDVVLALKQECDFVIVLYHGGKEYYRYPSPLLQKVCRKFVDKGADLVLCQHSHCIGCEEKYKEGTIVYGQGNFLFDDSEDECWQTGLLVKVSDDFKISYIPVRKHRENVRLADQNDAKKILDEFLKRSNDIQKPGFVETKYQELADSMRAYYLQQFRGISDSNVVMRALNKITHKRWRIWLMQNIYDDQKMRSIKNCLQCEAHRELILMGLKEDY